MNKAIHPVQQIDFTKSPNAYVIEASAGTGKTWTIERLYIRALLEASNPSDNNILLSVENILVVTFTNDATDELKERLYLQIEKSINLIIYLQNHKDRHINVDDIFTIYLHSRQDNYKKDVMVLTRAVQNFDQAAILTIHGFCNKVLHDYQFECQVNPEFELVLDKTEIFKPIVFNFLRSQILTAPKFIDNLDIVMNNLYNFFSDSYQTPLIDRIVNKLPKDLFKIDRANYAIKYQFQTPADINFLATEIAKEDKTRFKAEFLAYLIVYIYQYYPHQDSRLFSYDELIQKMADSLMNSNELADKIFYKYPVAFIDEFQDTDLLQWQIFSKIYHLGRRESNNSKSRGNVVVVGDPKQAIYRFRGADIDTYIEARSAISNHLNLIHNYRSHTNIMNFINHLFALPNQNSSVENSYLGSGIDYSHIIASAKSSDNLLTAKHKLQEIFAKYNIQQNIYDEEVQIVAIRGATKVVRTNGLLKAMTFEILALLNANSNLKGKIAVLVTKNREALELVKYFANFGIKAAELKLGNIFATNTASELYTILSSLLDLANRQNFMLAITTKIFNISLTTLADKENNLVLELYHQRFFRYGQIWESSGIFSLIYSILEDIVSDKKNLTNRELANLWQLAELLNKRYQRINNQIELLFWFKDRINKAVENLVGNIDADNEELIRLENDDEQIIITTQHKAKGMEYEILFCPYFKNSITLDGQFDFNYKRPFFSNYRKDDIPYSELVLDPGVANYIVEKDNKEVHRLNYVALTRAKSRIYIYLKQNTITRATGKYNIKEKPDKLTELFGYIKSNPGDTSHPLFNYSQFFSDTPQLAIKDSAKFPGVAVYNRDNLTEEDLHKLKSAITTQAVIPVETGISNSHYKQNTSYCLQTMDPYEQVPSHFEYSVALPTPSTFSLKTAIPQYQTAISGHDRDSKVKLMKVRPDFKINSAYFRQSYSGLTKTDEFDKSYDYYEKSSEEIPIAVNYRYKILSDKDLSGAVFGTLFHELCEIYPFSGEKLESILRRYDVEDSNHQLELTAMLKEAFSYPLLDGKCLSEFSDMIHELEFNITVDKTAQVHKLITKHYGSNHPFSLASQLLGGIKAGFLLGFMDVCFLHNDKYWVLDYKTNSLIDYTGSSIIPMKMGIHTSNSIIESIANHHYYLQYLLYLVALKRYLQVRLKVEDATDLIGGSVYYYVRGIYTQTPKPGDGVFIDNKCQQLVSELDKLLK